MTRHALLAASAAAALAVAHGSARADEGMWTFDNFPAAKVKQAYGVDVTQAWLDKVRASAVRLTSGCSASVVSPDGLVLTNHHCVVECVQNLSTPQQDYVAGGFFTATREEEKRCPGMQAEILTGITDVSKRMIAAGAGKTGSAFVQAQDAASAAIEQEGCGKDEAVRCEVVDFYRGGQFKLLKYRKYSDVRLAFAPELAAAFFGGDPDNFNFPRYALDFSLVRLYDGGKPIKAASYLKWNAAAPKENDVVFVAGNPGSTNRLQTLAQLAFQRDVSIPISQLQRSELRGRYIRFGEEGAEQKRIVTDPLFGLENSFKAFYGRQQALQDPAFMAVKAREEADLKARVAADPKLTAEVGDPWGEIETAQAAARELYLRNRMLEQAAGGGSELYTYAREIVRAAQERAKPGAERLPEYADSRLALFQKQLLDPQPVDPALEEINLAFWLAKTREYLTTDAPETRLLLGKESPEGLARRLVAGSKLADPAVRKALYDGGLAAVQASDDPMIQFALRTEGAGRTARKAWEERVTAPTNRAAERIARARFAAYGDQLYPDANFTLRLSYGQVKGWTHQGTTVPPFTYVRGLYERATGQEPFVLAPRLAAAQAQLNPDTVFDLSTTNDIIGGNSGSPLINSRGEVIGAVFDGNIHSLGGAYGYDAALNRTVAVSTAVMTEALTKAYGQARLAAELTGSAARRR